MQSLAVLKGFKDMDRTRYTKSAMMLGIGETEGEVITAMKDLRAAEVDFLAMGQYLRPTQHHLEVKEYVRPEIFDHYREIGVSLGFKYVAAGPFVRSSYKAGEFFIKSVVAKSTE